jgi:subtilisin family serine protease
MATKHVIAYPMHEHEWDAAAAIQQTQVTDSFVIGNIEEKELDDLRAGGLIVDELPDAGRATTAAMARRELQAATGIEGWQPGEDLPAPIPEPGETVNWIVSLDGPLAEDRRNAVDATGMVLQEYVPNFSYVAAGTPEQADEMINLSFVQDVVRYGSKVTGPIELTKSAAVEHEATTGAGGVTWAAPPVGNRPPAPPREGRGPEAPSPLEERPVTTPDPGRKWDLWLANESIRPEVLDWLAGHDVDVDGSGGRKVRIALSAEAEAELAQQIATLPGVLNMIEHVPPKLFNDVARQILGVTSANPGQDLKYQGEGQIIAVADTGLDDTHPDFNGRVVGLVALGRPGNPSDPNGHGTHVAGSVLGDGAASARDFRGVAPKAKLYFQSLMDSQDGLGGLPVSLESLFEPAYQAGARVHNNSWGAATSSSYTVDSMDVDEYVSKRRDMLVVIAAGNEGTAAVNINAGDGFVDWLSLGSPATSKNALTVGAARSSRSTGGLSELTYGRCWPRDYPLPPISTELVSGDPEALAAFSSRGPCDDRRIKPDLVAPGTDILSTRSSTAPADHYWGLHANNRYAYMGGTSMASPLAAGCAALVREYFVTERGISPSAALLKAALINGTRWLTSSDSIADHGQQPNYHQGFGEIHLPTTLPSAAEPTLALEFVDTWQTPPQQLKRTGDMIRYTVTVNQGRPLRLCLAYTDLPARALQNDLSLLVEDSTGNKFTGNEHLPGKITRSDMENNVEVIRIDDPAPGVWRLQVFARNLLRGPQDFALVATGALVSQLRRSPG